MRTLSQIIFAELKHLRAVQRRLEILKPELDAAIAKIQKIAVVAEKVEKSEQQKESK